MPVYSEHTCDACHRTKQFVESKKVDGVQMYLCVDAFRCRLAWERLESPADVKWPR